MQYIYSLEEANPSLLNLLGTNGISLSEITALGLPVPKGFVISSEVCRKFLEDSKYPSEFHHQLDSHLAVLEEKTKKIYADETNPLLLSVRVGSEIVIPGTMPTVLNLGLNDKTLQGLINQTKNPRFAYDTYQRFIYSFSTTVLNLPKKLFQDQIEAILNVRDAECTAELGEADLKELVSIFKGVVRRETGEDFPENPEQQLKLTLEVAFQSWNATQALLYRKINGLGHLLGAALTVQAMVYGNLDDSSGTGLMYTRNPGTGENQVYGEYLMNSQGGDIAARQRATKSILILKTEYPRLYEELIEAKEVLEKHYKDMQEIEFTIEQGKIYLLNSRKARRQAQADVKVTTDLVREGILSEKEALLNVDAKALDQLLHPSLERLDSTNILAVGFPASPGAASGEIVFSAQEAVEAKERGRKVVFFSKEINLGDVDGIKSAVAIVSSSGGITGQVSVMARKFGKSCISGCTDLIINPKARRIVTPTGEVLSGGETVTVDGRTGQLLKGEVPLLDPVLSDEFNLILKWADKYRDLKIKVNADSLEDSHLAKKFGAEGVGLVRTEQMFFSEDRVRMSREYILSGDSERKEEILATLLNLHRQDFMKLFGEFSDMSVSIRLFDPPLGDFFDMSQVELESLAETTKLSPEELKVKIDLLRDINPMSGHRGVRLAITNPEFYKMQTQAIVEAALDCQTRGIKVSPEIIVPMISNFTELKYIRAVLEKEAERYMQNAKFDLRIGVLLEIPRACLTADEIAEHADFLSFGTNDLTQTTYGLSRNDSGKFLADYFREGIITSDPASELDEKGVGRLMRIATQGGRSVNLELSVGICGEHGGDPRSIDFCHRIGLDYISCSPFSLPIARVAAAQAAIRNEIKVQD